MSQRRRRRHQPGTVELIREPANRARCEVRFTAQFLRACESLRELGPDRNRRSTAGAARAEQFFKEWRQTAAGTEHELSRGRWRYKPLDCMPPVTPRLRQIYLSGPRSVSRAALTGVESESVCIMRFLLAYDKDEQDAAIERACALVTALSEREHA